MLHGSLLDASTHSPFLGHPTWQKAIAWLQAMPANIALGTHELEGEKMFASVQSYETQAREACRFESHQAHIDIQYTISGAELIDWCLRGLLRPDGGFANDVQFWFPPEGGYTSLLQSAGRFSIFFPEDAHRPKVQVGKTGLVTKVVIKIHRSLLD